MLVSLLRSNTIGVLDCALRLLSAIVIAKDSYITAPSLIKSKGSQVEIHTKEGREEVGVVSQFTKGVAGNINDEMHGGCT